MKKITIGQMAKVCLVWNVKPCDYSTEQEASIIAAMASKYSIPTNNIKVEPKFIVESESNEDVSLNQENIQNIQDPLFQQQLFKKYLSENGIDDCDFDEICKIDSQINSLVDYSAYEKSKRYNIQWVKWSNFLSYGPDNYFDFTKLKGLVLLNGQPANESGKSTFAYDLLHYLLFGKTQTDKANTIGQLFNNYIPEATTMEVEGCISLDGEQYIIKRTLSRSALTAKNKENRKVTTKVEYYKLLPNGDRKELLDGENEQGASTTETNKIIKEALGNETDFDRIISANSKDLDALISMKDTERGRVLSKWIGLSVLEDKDVIARERWNKDISKKRYCDLYNKSDLETQIGLLKENNEVSKENITSQENKIALSQKRLDDYQQTLSTLVSARKAVDVALLKTDITTLSNNIQSLIATGKATASKIKSVESQISQYGEITVNEDEYKQHRNSSEKLTKEISSMTTEIRLLKSENSKLANSEFCPTCGRKYDNVDNSPKIKENEDKIALLTKEIAVKENEQQDIKAKMSQIEQDRIAFNNKNKLELQKSALNTELLSQRNKYKEKDALLKEIQKNKEIIEENNRIDNTINVTNASIKAENIIITNCNYSIATHKGAIQNNLKKIDEFNAIISQIEVERKIEKNWKIYLQMIGKDGISKMVLRNTLPIINGEIKRLLNDVADFDVEVSINEKNDVDFWLTRDGIKTKLAAASGLERTQSALALRTVLGSMSKLSRPPFVLLDEVLGTVSKENYDNMKKLYDKIVEKYDFILHITHLSEIADWHNQTVTVIKENNISRIK